MTRQKVRQIGKGDLLKMKENPPSLLIFQEPMDVHRYWEDKNNPKFNFIAGETEGFYNGHLLEYNSQEKYLVINHKDMFDKQGFRKRYIKITGLKDASSGWIKSDSFELIVESGEPQQ